MRFLSLFAGIGGFDIGLERAGMTCAGQVEIDPFCCRVLEKHWPNVKRAKDIKNVDGKEFGPVELICGGFPCQPFSLAGKQKGAKDNRYLWPEMLRVIEACRPAWIIGENVAGIIGLELDKVLSSLEGVGYQVQPFVIPACAVDAAHRRDRVWILGHSASVQPRRKQSTGDNEARLPSTPRAPQALVADAERISERPGFCENEQGRERGRRPSNGGCEGSDVAYSKGERLEGRDNGGERLQTKTLRLFSPRPRECEDVPDNGCGSRKRTRPSECGQTGPARWIPEPGLGRVAHGIPARVDRLKSLGNAVVPQVVEVIGRAIMQTEGKKW